MLKSNNFQKKKASDKYLDVAVSVCGASIIGVVFSPSIPVTCLITAVAVSVVYYATKKIAKLKKSESAKTTTNI